MAQSEDEIYQEHVLEHYEDPYHRGSCPTCTHCHQDDNPLCGDVVKIELEIDPLGRIASAYFDGDGCCISQASASMLIERFEGRTVDEVRQFTANDMLALFGARLTPNRQKCCLLPWRVLQTAIYAPLERCGETAKECQEDCPRHAEHEGKLR
jgi:nitrogen fixation NifU-like protein